jgi:hypothetical protein
MDRLPYTTHVAAAETRCSLLGVGYSSNEVARFVNAIRSEERVPGRCYWKKVDPWLHHR